MVVGVCYQFVDNRWEYLKVLLYVDQPTSRGRSHKLGLDLASLTFYPLMVEFMGWFELFDTNYQLGRFVKLAKLWRSKVVFENYVQIWPLYTPNHLQKSLWSF